MEDYPKYYIRLYTGVIYAMDALLLKRPEEALEILADAQEEAEELYLAEMDEAL